MLLVITYDIFVIYYFIPQHVFSFMLLNIFNLSYTFTF